jgi:hypothetical protein
LDEKERTLGAQCDQVGDELAALQKQRDGVRSCIKRVSSGPQPGIAPSSSRGALSLTCARLE